MRAIFIVSVDEENMAKSEKLAIPRPRKEIEVEVDPADPEVTHRNHAKAVIAPEVSALRIVAGCENSGMKDQLDMPALIRLLKDRGEAVNRGDMTHAEQMLSAQATALQALFTRMVERALQQSHMPNLEAFMRLALKSQSQCRATLEALAAIKNPPVIYAKQINQTTGLQQVNNGVAAPSRTQEIESERNKLLRGDHEPRMDSGTTGEAIGSDPALEAVGAIDRAKVPRG